jgi:outer membrane protein assembly factor BamB
MHTELERLQKARQRGRWVLMVWLALLAGGLIYIWVFRDVSRQNKLLTTAGVLAAGYAGFLVWVLFGSRWRARARWAVFLGTIAAVIICRFTLRISGVNGDLLPIVEWRWKKARVVSVETPAGARSAESLSLTNRYPQFLGPNRDGTLPGPALARDWKLTPPRELWRHAVGSAWSGFAVEGARAITQEQRGAEELVVCYDALTGAQLWAHADTSRYATVIAGEGPRATPTIVGDRVFSIGGAGVLNCLELATGKELWSKDTLAEHGAKVPEWGVASSPLITERAVIVAVGGNHRSLVAYACDTGEKLWAAGHDDAHWSSPVRVTLAGVPQILIFSQNVTGHDEQTGAVLWQYPWRNPFPHVSVPLVLTGDRVLVSQGYAAGSELIQITHETNKWRAKPLWKSIRMKSKFGTLIHQDGFVYGLDDGALACIDAATGELKWKGDRYGHGQMILVDGLLLLMAESGDVVLLEPNSAEQRELARHKVFTAKTWNPPALAGDLLFIRNDREAACLRLPLAR